MENIKIAIVDDLPEDLAAVKNCILQYEKEYQQKFELTAYSSSVEFLEKYKGQ